MFSALKRWTKMGSEESKLSMPSGVKAMGQALQRKFARGVQYNMKIIIKGDRNTGKTCMFHRLQGKPFNEQYIPTNEIQAGSIHWSYKAADDIVKVDVWDIVDVGKSRKPSDSLKIENNTPTDDSDDVVADANFLDVYKGTHGVIMVMDITKPWTFQYIRRELPKVPAHIPVLVLGSHRDMEEHRLIDQEEVTNFIQNLERPDRSPPIHYAESSMKNGFGLKYIHTFLNFPFLLLQREALLQQLQVNAMDMESTLEELQLYKHTEEQDYYKYLDFLEEKKKEREKKLKAEAEAQKAVNDETKNDENASLSSASPPQTNKEKQAARKGSQGGGMRRWFSGSKPNITNDEVPKQQPKQQTSSNAGVTPSNIEEFKPEEELDAGFLDEESSTKEKSNVKNKQKQVEKAKTPSESSDESDSESGPVNPMVASFAEDISDDETVTNGNIQSEDMAEKLDVKLRPAVTDVHITSSEEEEEDKEETIEVLKPEVLKPTPLTTSKNKTKGTGLKMDIKGSLGTARIEQKEKKRDMVDEIDDWLDSPDPEPKISYGLPKEIDYTVTKVDINKPIESPTPAPVSMDEWSLFMAQQMSINEKKSKKSKSRELLHDSDEEQANESRHHKKKDHKSGGKSRSKKHKKHKEKDEENEVEKERRKSKHKETEKEKQKPEDNERKKRSKHKPSKKKSVETSGNPEGQTYEEL